MSDGRPQVTSARRNVGERSLIGKVSLRRRHLVEIALETALHVACVNFIHLGRILQTATVHASHFMGI